MRRVIFGSVVIGLLSVGASVAYGQRPRFGFGGGLTAPTSDYATADKAGWHLLGKVDISIPMSPVSVRVDGLYGQTSHKDSSGVARAGNTKLGGGTADVVWHVPTTVPGFKPYLLAGGGVFNAKETFPSGTGTSSVSSTKFAWGAGAGVSLGVGPVHGFVEGRYMSVQTSGTALKFMPLTVGVSF
jgi:opacity protein-like surface antigen